MKCLIYCTKDNHQLVKPKDYDKYLLFTKGAVNYSREQILNGKVVAEFECNNVEEIRFDLENTYFDNYYYMSSMNEPTICKKSCLTKEQLNNYLGTKGGYAIHIENLKVFDRPMELKELYKKYDRHDYSPVYYMPITKAPQNMMWVWYKVEEKYCLISIRPEWVCKILNGEKTIEVRKKVLKGMLGNDND